MFTLGMKVYHSETNKTGEVKRIRDDAKLGKYVLVLWGNLEYEWFKAANASSTLLVA